MKLIIAGTRELEDKKCVIELIDKVVKDYELDVTEVIEGECRGPDKFGREWAEKRGIKVTKYPAEWDYHGRQAGPIRNQKMSEVGDMLLAFVLNGQVCGIKDVVFEMHSGTFDMINKMKAKYKPIITVTMHVDKKTVHISTNNLIQGNIDDIWGDSNVKMAG